MVNRIKSLFYLPVILSLFTSAGFFASQNLSANNVVVSAKLDSSLMVIGGQMNLTIEISQPKNIKTIFPDINDTITKDIEVLEITKPDTIFHDDQRLSLTQIYRVTSFDSGLYYIPPMLFEYFDGELAGKATTEPLVLMVINPFEEVDPQKGFFDLKNAFNLSFILSELWPYRYWFFAFYLLLIISGLGVYYYMTREIPLKEVFFPSKPKEPPHITALRSLETIKNEKLWQAGRIKLYHSQLTDTLRKYMEGRYEFPALEQTTSEIMDELRQIELPDKNLYNKMEQVLNIADLAKFAKFEPSPDENESSLINAYFFVNQTKIEELLTPEELRKKASDAGSMKDNENHGVSKEL